MYRVKRYVVEINKLNYELRRPDLSGLFGVSLLGLGRLAQLGEHRPYKPRVTGSSPVPPTNEIKELADIG